MGADAIELSLSGTAVTLVGTGSDLLTGRYDAFSHRISLLSTCLDFLVTRSPSHRGARVATILAEEANCGV